MNKLLEIVLFFEEQVSPASALFAREIILNPTAAEKEVKPLWMSGYWAQLFGTVCRFILPAFNNTVLKGMARKYGKRSLLLMFLKLWEQTTMMTGVAVMD